MMYRIPVTVIEDFPATLAAYVVKPLKVALTQAVVSTIAYTVTDTVTGTAVSGHDAQSLTVSSIIIDTPVTASTDPLWTLTGGYNYKHVLAGTAFPSSDRIYAYEATITLTDGSKIPVLFDCRSVKLWKS